MSLFEKKIEEYMLRQGMLDVSLGDFLEEVSAEERPVSSENAAGIIVAVSGGADSVALLRVLSQLKNKYGFPLYVVHVHHGIRRAAERDATFTETLAAELEVPCRIRRIDAPAYAAEQKKTLEEAAREERYRVLREEKEALSCKWIAVAHHADDQAETVLMRMLRGTGIRGMRGMLPVNGDVIRPLLSVRRTEIEEYLAECGVEYVTDETNFTEEHMRNVIRLRLLPEMEKNDPGIVERLNRLAGDSQIIYGDMEKKLAMAAEKLELREEIEPLAKVSFSVEAARKVPAVYLYELLLGIFGRLSGSRKDFGRVHAADVAGLMEKETGKRISLPGGLVARRSYDRIIIEMLIPQKVFETNFKREIETAGSEHRYRWHLTVEILSREAISEISKKRYTKMIDYGTIKNSLFLRTPLPGDRLAVYPDGRTKKLGRFFTDSRIDANRRGSWPVVADGSEIVWAIGLRLSEAYKITEETREVAVLTVEPEESFYKGEETKGI